MMNKYSFFDYDSSDESELSFESSSESFYSAEESSIMLEEGTPFDALYHQFFTTSRLQSSLNAPKEQLRTIYELTTRVLDKIAIGITPNNKIANLSQLINNLCQTHHGAQKVLLIDAMKNFLQTLTESQLEDEDEFGMNTLSSFPSIKTTDLLETLLPKMAFFHNDMELGTIRIEVNGKVEAYFKSGLLRQQNDNFLHHFYLHLREQIPFPESMPPVFPKSFLFTVPVSEIKNNAFARENQAHLSTLERDRGKLICKTINLNSRENINAGMLVGSLQSALPTWAPQKITPSEQPDFLIFLSIILMLGGRDLKLDGIMGSNTGTIIDFEDFLEEKKNMPLIHLPFIAQFKRVTPSCSDWEFLEKCLDDLNLDEIISFVTRIKYTPVSACLTDFSDCLHKQHPANREEYTHRKPTFSEENLLSQAQIHLLIKNIKQLQTVLHSINDKTNLNIYQFIAKFDPIWEQQMIQFSVFSELHKKKSLNGHYDKQTIKEFGRVFSNPRVSPENIVGNVARSPSPTNADNLVEELADVSSGSPILSGVTQHALQLSLNLREVVTPSVEKDDPQLILTPGI